MRDAAFKSLAVGFFDGVHLGHQAILRGASSVLTFAVHPLRVLAPERAPRLIMTCEQRVAAVRACGVREVTVLEFTRETAAMAPEVFAERYVLNSRGTRGAVKVFCGENWRFGRDGVGDADFLRRMGVDVTVVPFAEYGGQRISSSRIRACIERGEIADANAMMGRRFVVEGRAERGKGLGKKLGYPTVNLRLPTLDLRLPHGVYVVETEGVRGVANWGCAPTMGERAWKTPVLEVHLLPPCAGGATLPRPVEQSTNFPVAFVDYLRPERKFDSVAELQRQIAEDCRRAEG